MISTMSSSVIDGDRAYSPPCNARVNLRARTARTKCEERRTSITPLTRPAATLHHRPAAALLMVVVVWVAIAADLIVHDLDVVVLSRVLNGRSHLAKFGFILHRHQRVTVHPEHDGRVGMI